MDGDGARPSAHNNTVGGQAQLFGPTVQARDVRGGVHLHAAPADRPPSPRQLLAVPAHFTSRRRDLERLDRLLAARSDDTSLLIVVSGQAGIGKTALVSRWLHTVGDGFPDGQFYADLRGHSASGPAGPGEVLAGFLRALGIGSVPADLGERASLWRSATAGRRIAVMLDNAFSAAQVRTLLPGGTRALVVATGRRRLSGLGIDGAAFHRLGVLDTTAGVELLARGIGRRRVDVELAAARDLVTLCAGLPLAVTLASARLATRPRQSLRALADTLSGAAGRLAALELEGEAAVRNALDASYAELTPDCARLYRALGPLPLTTFDPRSAAAACGQPHDRAEALLDELIEASLVEDIGPDTCRFHDLVRDHARDRGHQEDSPQARAAVLRAVCDWYLASATAAEQRLTPAQFVLPRDYDHPVGPPAEFSDDAAALRWLDDERDNLMGLVRAAADHGLDGTAWQLVDAMWPLFLRLRHYDLWTESHRIGLAAAQRSGHNAAELQMLNSGAIGLTSAGHLDEAAAWYARSAEAARALDDVRGEGQALHGLGTCHRQAGRFEQAEPFLRRAIEVWEGCGYPRGAALSRIVLGEIALAVDEPAAAVGHFDRAHTVLLEADDPYDACRALAFLGRARARDGDVAEGMAQLRSAVEAFDASGATHWEARALEMLGECAEAAGDPASAAAHWNRAVTLHSAADPVEAARLRRRLAGLGPA